MLYLLFRLICNINANHRSPYLRNAGGSVLMDTALYFSSFPSKISSHSDAFSRVTLVAKFVCNRDLTQIEHCTNCCPEAGLGDYEVGAAYRCFLDIRPFKRKGITYRVMMLQSFSSPPWMQDVSIVMGIAYTESLWTYAGSFLPKEQD